MKKKAHRLKFKHTTRQDVTMEFNTELLLRMDNELLTEAGHLGVLKCLDYKIDHWERIRIEQKIKLLKEWECAGRNIAFSDEKIGELICKKYSVYNDLIKRDIPIPELEKQLKKWGL